MLTPILRFLLFVQIALVSTPFLFSQKQDPQAAPRDTQALTVLTDCVTAAGGIDTISHIKDFVATGTITYHWADQAVQGAAKIRGLGLERFRIDADLPAGTQSLVVVPEETSTKGVDGTSATISNGDAQDLGSLTLPVLRLNAALSDTSIGVVYVALVDLNGQKLHQIRIVPAYSTKQDPEGTLTKLGTLDLFVNPSSYLLVKTQSIFHSPDQDFSREITFSDYRGTGGLLVPFSISETISGQATWTLQLSAMTLNNGLTDADFQL